MKKTLITIIIVLGACTATLAQQKKGDIELGFNTGFNVATITHQNFGSSPFASDFNSTRVGFNFAVAADLYFSNRWSIKGKLTYDQKGEGDFSFSSQDGSTISGKSRLNYLTVPVMANWHFGKTRNWYLNFGPYAGFLTNDQAFVKSTDFGLAFGIGVKIPLSDKLKLTLEYDRQSGFSNISKTPSTPTIRNSRESLNVGLNFMLK